ncbi:hypothetical protein AX16_006356 [Volvariella volvacea WC 439]|nr:hypothetical protein AX16_006356 [Volvariella volvacea WC 439]
MKPPKFCEQYQYIVQYKRLDSLCILHASQTPQDFLNVHTSNGFNVYREVAIRALFLLTTIDTTNSKFCPTKKKLFNILLCGETCSGKTSFASLLINLFQGRGLQELRDNYDEGKGSDCGTHESQTINTKLHTTTASDGTQTRILDMPGLAGTHGVDDDATNKAEIVRFIRASITSIDAVVIVANGTAECSRIATSYALDAIARIFSGSIIDNIGFVFTNCDIFTFNFKMDNLEPELRESKHWLIQNPLALYRNYSTQREQDVPEEILEVHLRKLEGIFEEAVKTLNGFVRWLDERKVQLVKEVEEVEKVEDLASMYEMTTNIGQSFEAPLSSILCLVERWEEMGKVRPGLGNAKQPEDVQKRLQAARDSARKELEDIRDEMNKLKEEIRCRVDYYNKLALSTGFAEEIQSAIAVFEYYRKRIESKEYTEAEVKLIDESVSIFKKKKDILEEAKGTPKQGIVHKVLSSMIS